MSRKSELEMEIIEKLHARGYKYETISVFWEVVEDVLGKEYALTGDGIKRIRTVKAKVN